MKCPDFEHWISDLADGELPEAKGRILEKHLLICPSCRAYKSHVDLLREELQLLDQSSAAPESFQSFSERLRIKLEPQMKPRRSRIFIDLGWKWAYAAVATAFVAVMMFVLITPSQQLLQDERIVVTSFEDGIRQIYRSIGEDSELEKLFNTMLLASITAEVENPNWSEGVDYGDELEFFQGVTEEEMQILKNIKRKTEG
jgi:predicted anti-sigma-YlaC factor YlaD